MLSLRTDFTFHRSTKKQGPLVISQPWTDASVHRGEGIAGWTIYCSQLSRTTILEKMETIRVRDLPNTSPSPPGPLLIYSAKVVNQAERRKFSLQITWSVKNGHYRKRTASPINPSSEMELKIIALWALYASNYSAFYIGSELICVST